MYLTATNLAYYLINRGLVDPASVVDGDLMIIEAGRRNRNFKVLRGNKPGLFVKQINNARTWEPIVTLHREASLYEMFRTRGDLRPLADIAPRLIDHNPSNCSLIVELVPDGENLREHHQRNNAVSPAVSASVGRGLATYQVAGGGVAREQPASPLFARQVPWVLTLDAPDPAVLAYLGSAGSTFVELLRGFPVIVAHLAAIRGEWRHDSLIHGDMKWDNLLISPGSSGDPVVHVVDWELVDIGDSSWDVGSFMASFLIDWLLTSAVTQQPGEVTQAASPERFLAMRRAMGWFWKAYADALHLSAAAAGQHLVRCVRFAAARLVLAVFEYLYSGLPVSPALVGVLHASQGIFVNPGQAATSLLSFETET